jgi:HEAT repeat protein
VSGPGIGAGPGNSGTTGVSSSGGANGDLTQWTFWWEFNKEPYIQLKRAIHSGQPETASAGWFLGDGEKDQARDSHRPSPQQIRQVVVPALRAALGKESDKDIITGCLIALAKIGDAPSESGASEFEPMLRAFLASKNQEISETAAIALGILAHQKSIDTLAQLLGDSDVARTWVGQPEVPYRTRAFAAYGLGLVGAKIERESDRLHIVEVLHDALRSDQSKTRDVKAACVLAMGMVPLEADSTEGSETKDVLVQAPRSRSAQLDWLLAFLRDERENFLVRAHCPRSLARLCNANLPHDLRELYRARIAEALLGLLESKAPDALLASATLALGQIGTNDLAHPLDRRILETLAAAPKQVGDQQARLYSLIGLAQVGARTASDAKDAEGGTDFAAKALLAQLADGKSGMPSWAGLACGVFGSGLQSSTPGSGKVLDLQNAVRLALAEERSAERIGALAVSAGIQHDLEATRVLLKLLSTTKEDEAQGYVALGLGLMNAREALEPIRALLVESKYKPVLLRQAAIALGLLGDKNVVGLLTTQLAAAKGLATQAALSTALGTIGDTHAVEPLVRMLQDSTLTAGARGFAAAALGMVADQSDLPWNCAIGLDLNYRAATPTLTDHGSGTGILDIL